MGLYKDPIEYKPHSFNSSTLTLDREHVVEGLDTVECEMDEDEWEQQSVASGATIPVHNPIESGEFRFTFLEASATTDWLTEKLRAHGSISFSFTDENAPNLNANSRRAYIRKRPMLKRGKEVDVPQWILSCPYLKCEGGSYALESEV